MPENVPPSTSEKPTIDELYLRIWEEQQKSLERRWNAIAIFISISFAIFGLSFQSQDLNARLLERVFASAIYWFSYLVYLRFSDWSEFLMTYLAELESTGSTRIDLQSRWARQQKGFRGWRTVKRLLFCLGLVYVVMVVLLWQLKV